jgi:predicted anti-sigma-YlaC factor YlaD
MTCEDVKKELALGMLGLGSPDKQKELEIHVESCRDCAQRIGKARSAKAAIAGNEPVPPPDWDASWREIDAQALRKKRPLAFPTLRDRWALAAVVAAVFILGAVAGRLLLFNPKPTPPSDIFAGMSPAAAWRGYADRLELLLVDIGNRAEIERTRNIIQREKALIEQLLAETRALKSLFAIQGDDARAALLNDAELILAKIVNLKPGDKKSSEEMAKIVRESPLKTKLRTIKYSDVIL